jgi:hypothetical protein
MKRSTDMKLTNRTIASLLALLTAASVMTACGSGTQSGTPGQTEAPDNTAQTTAATEDTAPVIDWTAAGIEAVDFGGEELHFIVQTINSDTYAWFMMDPEEANGEGLNDAIFNRNAKIEELFNVQITGEYNDAPHTQVSKAVSAGDGAYDAMLHALNNTYTIARTGGGCTAGTVQRATACKTISKANTTAGCADTAGRSGGTATVCSACKRQNICGIFRG